MTLDRGDRGPDVERVQRALRELGFDIVADGVFGPGTERAVREFQSNRGLVADGRVGPNTLAALGLPELVDSGGGSTAGSMVYRLRVDDLGEPHMASFTRAMRSMQGLLDNRGFNHVAGFHGAPFWYCWHHQQNVRVPIRAELFLPWHRAYLQHLELLLNDQVGGVALPWWDWTVQRGIPQAYADDAGETLSGSTIRLPLTNPPVNRRTFRRPEANQQVELPTSDQIGAVLEDTDWFSFSDRLQGYHDDVHVWVGGDMTNQATAAYDPIFFAHHAAIDRVWYLWQVRHGNGGIPQSLLGMSLEPFGKRFVDVIDVAALGYEYALTSSQIPVR